MWFWQNPECVRHVRAHLRSARAMTAAGVSVVIAGLVALPNWAVEQPNLEQLFYRFFIGMAGIQFAVVGLGCAYYCGQAISQERMLKTYDFLRTTRLTAAELMIGMILGAPILGYFFAGCLAVFALPAAILGGIAIGVILRMYSLLLVVALFVGVSGLWFSTLNEKSSAGGFAFLILIFVSYSMTLSLTPFPGSAAVSPIPALLELFSDDSPQLGTATFFGVPVSFLFMTVMLYVLFGSWLVLMLLRNLKKDRPEIRLLTRWQAIGFATFLNLLFYCLLAPGPTRGSLEIVTTLMALNAAVLFAAGLATLSPREKLKLWWRGRQREQETYFLGVRAFVGPGWFWWRGSRLVCLSWRPLSSTTRL